MNDQIADYSSPSGRFEAVWTLEIQTVPADIDTILDAIVEVYPLAYGRFERTASISAVGKETARPPGTDESPARAETYPMVELKVSIERDLATLEQIMSVVLDVHHHEEPVIFLREDWVSRASYDPHSTNPHRWWNNGRGLPQRIG